MTQRLSRWLRTACVVAAVAALGSRCVVDGGGYYGGGGAPEYYEPSGVVYGGWGPNYHVAPWRDDGRHVRPDHPERGGALPHHAFRSAPESHSIPSIPSRGRADGGGRR